jgi:hypothetical protein
MKNYFKNNDFGTIAIQSFGVLLIAVLLAFMFWVAIDAFLLNGLWFALFVTFPFWGVLLLAYSVTGGKYNA